MIPDLSILIPLTHWHCPFCTATSVTREAQPHTRMHSCMALGGLTAPMLREGEDSRLVVNEREDYVGGEDVTVIDGRPVMSITTEHADGATDVAVYAPSAHGEIHG